MSGADYELAGYVAFAAQGLALPCFRRGPHSNAWYRATCHPILDHRGHISGFEMIEDVEVTLLKDDLIVPVEIGSAWRDVFVWEGNPFCGTPQEIWDTLRPAFPALIAGAPLSLLDIAPFVEDSPLKQLVGNAYKYLSNVHGKDVAKHWRDQNLLWTLAQRLAAGARAQLQRTVNIHITADAGFLYVEGDKEAIRTAFDQLVAFAEGLDLVLVETGRTAQKPVIASTIDERPALIVVQGPRAAQIAKQFRDANWRARFKEEEEIGYPSILRIDQPHNMNARQRHQVHVTENPSGNWNAADYAAIVVLTDDGGADEVPVFRAMLQRHVSVYLLAPALPADTPSELLYHSDESNRRTEQFDATIDTSIARSPFCAFAANRSLERRVGDIVIGAAYLACFAAVRREIIAFAETNARPLLSFTAPVPGAIRRSSASRRSTIATDTYQQMASESTWGRYANGNESQSLVFSVVASGAPPEEGELRLREGHSDFPDFVEAIFGDPVKGTSAAPLMSPITAALDFPKLAALLKTPQGEIIVTAETPTLEAVRQAHDDGTLMLRYTDEETLDKIINEHVSPRNILPRQIRLGRIGRLSTNARLVNRGVDQRDVVRIELEQGDDIPAALNDVEPRRLLGAKNGKDGEVLVVPRRRLEALAKDDTAVRHLLTLDRPPADGKRAFTRPADVNYAWSPVSPRCSRYAIKDGAIPIRIVAVSKDAVASQDHLVFDGDWAAAALFLSRPFELWARATTRMPNGWGARFSVIATFETFPLPANMELNRRDQAVALVYTGDNERKRASEARAEIEHIIRPGPRWRDAEHVPPDMRRAVNAFVSDLYGFKQAPSDVEILERLVELNRARAETEMHHST